MTLFTHIFSLSLFFCFNFSDIFLILSPDPFTEVFFLFSQFYIFNFQEVFSLVYQLFQFHSTLFLIYCYNIEMLKFLLLFQFCFFCGHFFMFIFYLSCPSSFKNKATKKMSNNSLFVIWLVNRRLHFRVSGLKACHFSQGSLNIRFQASCSTIPILRSVSSQTVYSLG